MRNIISTVVTVIEILEKGFAILGALFAIFGAISPTFYSISFDFPYLMSLLETVICVLVVAATCWLVYRAFWRKIERDLHFLAFCGALGGVLFGLLFNLDGALALKLVDTPVLAGLIRVTLTIIAIAGVITLVAILTEDKATQSQG